MEKEKTLNQLLVEVNKQLKELRQKNPSSSRREISTKVIKKHHCGHLPRNPRTTGREPSQNSSAQQAPLPATEVYNGSGTGFIRFYTFYPKRSCCLHSS